LLKCLSAHPLDLPRAGRPDSESDTAVYLVLSLLEDKIDKAQVYSISEQIMKDSSSLYFAFRVYREHPLLDKHGKDVEGAVFTSMRKALFVRFNDGIMKPRIDFFKTGEPDYVLLQLWDLCQEVEKVGLKDCTCAGYVKDILERNPKYIGRILNVFVVRSTGTQGSSIQLNISEMKKYFDIDKLYEKIKVGRCNAYTTDSEKKAVELLKMPLGNKRPAPTDSTSI
jgi:hypothetical protein